MTRETTHDLLAIGVWVGPIVTLRSARGWADPAPAFVIVLYGHALLENVEQCTAIQRAGGK